MKSYIGQLIDVFSFGEWLIGYGHIVEETEDGKIKYELAMPAHDGCYWCYSTEKKNIRLTAEQ